MRDCDGDVVLLAADVVVLVFSGVLSERRFPLRVRAKELCFLSDDVSHTLDVFNVVLFLYKWPDEFLYLVVVKIIEKAICPDHNNVIMVNVM